VGRWLLCAGLPTLVPLARAAGADGELLLALAPREWRALGVADAAHMRALFAATAGAAGGAGQALALEADICAALGTPAALTRTAASFAAASAGRLEALRSALCAGLPPGAAQGAEGATLLMVACAGGHRRLADLLLARGAPLNARDAAGRTALDRCTPAVDPDGSLAEYLRLRGGRTGAEETREG